MKKTRLIDVLHKTVLNLQEVVLYTGLSKSHIYKLTHTGRIPCYKPHGRYIYFSKIEIDAWLLSKKIPSAQAIEIAANTHALVKR